MSEHGGKCGEWLCGGTLVYELEEFRDRGKPSLRNRWWAYVQGYPDTPKEELEAVARMMHAAPKLLAALRGIVEIGKRDMSNPKYDGYFDYAREAIAEATKP